MVVNSCVDSPYRFFPQGKYLPVTLELNHGWGWSRPLRFNSRCKVVAQSQFTAMWITSPTLWYSG